MLKNKKDGVWGEIERMRNGLGGGGRRKRRIDDSSLVLIFEEANEKRD